MIMNTSAALLRSARTTWVPFLLGSSYARAGPVPGPGKADGAYRRLRLLDDAAHPTHSRTYVRARSAAAAEE